MDPSRAIEITSTRVVDDVAPTTPVVSRVEYFANRAPGGCGSGAPGGGVDSPQLVVHLEPITDDGTPEGRLTLAFHPGATALTPASEPWLAISAIDRAGNESPRSPAFTY